MTVVRNTDRALFEKLLTDNWNYIQNMRNHRRFRGPLADDVLGDTLLRVSKYWYMFTPKTESPDRDFRNWVMMIMIRSQINMFRRATYRFEKVSEHFDIMVKMTSFEEEECDTDFEYSYDKADSMKNLMDRLYEGMREVSVDMLIDYEILQLSYKEIAEKHGCPIGTVMSRLYRAREKARAILSEEV